MNANATKGRVTTGQFLTKYPPPQKKTILRNVLCIFALLATTLTKIHEVAAKMLPMYMDFFYNVDR